VLTRTVIRAEAVLRDRLRRAIFRRAWRAARPDCQEHVITLAAGSVQGADLVDGPRAGAVILIAGRRLHLTHFLPGVGARAADTAQTAPCQCDSDEMGLRARLGPELPMMTRMVE
jgi:hypothetical protein